MKIEIIEPKKYVRTGTAHWYGLGNFIQASLTGMWLSVIDNPWVTILGLVAILFGGNVILERYLKRRTKPAGQIASEVLND